MFKALTGREPTEAEKEELVAEIRADLSPAATSAITSSRGPGRSAALSRD